MTRLLFILLCACNCFGQVAALRGNVGLLGYVVVGPAASLFPTNDLALRISAENASHFSILADGRITNVTDLSSQGNIIAQTTTADCPFYRADDGLGRPCIVFPRWLVSKAEAKTYFQLTGAGIFPTLNSRTQTIYAVLALDQQVKNYGLLWRSDGGLALYFNQGTIAGGNTPPILWVHGSFTSTNNPKLFVPINRTVVTYDGSASAAVLGVNDQEVSLGTPTSVGGTNFVSMRIGGNNSTALTYYGRLYELLVYATNHSPTMRTSIVQTLTAKWGLNTNYSGVIVARGDSVTEGGWSTNWPSLGLAWPAYLNTRLNNAYKIFNLGISSTSFNTAGSGASNEIRMAGLLRDTTAPTNYLLQALGINDAAETDGAGIFMRLTNWAQSITMWPPSSIRPMTIISTTPVSSQDIKSNYNNLVIAGDSKYGSFIDIGLGTNTASVFGCSLCYTNTIYYNDGVHIQDAGANELARLVKEALGL